MEILSEIVNQLLLEQDNKLEVLRKAISERLPISIYYSGPSDEVREGQRIDIEPIVLGTHAKSGNLVVWAYVFKGISKRGLPGWKMFRIDRIKSAKYNNLGATNFKLEDLPGYQKGKAPSAMKSLSSVEIFSPYWFEDDERFKAGPREYPPEWPEVQPKPAVAPPAAPPVAPPIEKPTVSSKDALGRIYKDLQPQIRNINGQKTISQKDYDSALNNLYHSKEDEFKVYQRAISGNERPGSGTRKRFADTSKADIDNLFSKENIQISNNPEQLAEGHRIQSRIKRLINW
jgi:hypothetical protein